MAINGKVGTIGQHATTVHHFDNGNVAVTYHDTRVFHYVPHLNRVVLDTGGYKTATTKRRMNQALESYKIPLRVIQRNYEWFIESANGTVPFNGNVAHVRL